MNFDPCLCMCSGVTGSIYLMIGEKTLQTDACDLRLYVAVDMHR